MEIVMQEFYQKYNRDKLSKINDLLYTGFKGDHEGMLDAMVTTYGCDPLDHWDATRIRQMMQYSKKTKTGTLWILDDMINSSDAVSMSRSSLLNRLYMQGRHWKISIVLVSQKYTYIPSAIRINASHLCMYGANSKEQKTLFEEIANVDDLPRKYAEAVSKPYGFLYLELTSGRTFQCFERELL